MVEFDLRPIESPSHCFPGFCVASELLSCQKSLNVNLNAVVTVAVCSENSSEGWAFSIEQIGVHICCINWEWGTTGSNFWRDSKQASFVKVKTSIVGSLSVHTPCIHICIPSFCRKFFKYNNTKQNQNFTHNILLRYFCNKKKLRLKHNF